MKPIPQSIVTIALFAMAMIAGMDAHASRYRSRRSRSLALESPIDSEYLGPRELMDAPSNDLALNDDELRP